MSAYVVQAGDTFESLSRRYFGAEDRADDIRAANPGVVEPLPLGITVQIPEDAPKIQAGVVAQGQDPDDVVIEIDGEQFRYWEQVKTVSQLDSLDTLEFNTVFELSNTKLREMFRPFTYRSVNVMIGGERNFTGTIIGVNPNLTPNKLSLTVSAYARPGVLNDCQFPVSILTEFTGGKLLGIAKFLTKPFGLSVVLEGNQGPVFDQVEPEAQKKAYDYFADLAKQRNFLISNTPDGALLFLKPIATGKPVARLIYGQTPVTDIQPEFNPQEYYSHVTGTQMSVTGIEGSSYTLENKRLSSRGVLRPYTFEFKDITGPGIQEAVAAKMGRMLGNAVTYNVTVIGWRDPAGKLWRKNTTITLLAPEAMIYREYEFLIKRVELIREGDSKTAVLSLTLPGAYSGKVPEAMPWD